MNPLSKFCCRFVGLLAACCAVFALWYNLMVTASLTERNAVPAEARYFQGCAWMLTTLAACVAAGIGWGGIELIRLRQRGAAIIAFFGIAPLMMMSVVGTLWFLPHFGTSIAMASGVSMGGLVPVLITLLPLWAWLLRAFAFKLHSPAPTTRARR